MVSSYFLFFYYFFLASYNFSKNSINIIENTIVNPIDFVIVNGCLNTKKLNKTVNTFLMTDILDTLTGPKDAKCKKMQIIMSVVAVDIPNKYLIISGASLKKTKAYYISFLLAEYIMAKRTHQKF